MDGCSLVLRRSQISTRFTMKFDEVLLLLGDFGPYQKRIYLLLCLPSITCCMHILLTVFSMATPPHRCAIPGLDNDTYVFQSPLQMALANVTIPQGDSCHVIRSPHVTSILNNTSGTDVTSPNGSKPEVVPCSRYVYDTSVFTSTIVTEMNLVCEKQYSKSLAQTITMFGAFLGTLSCQPSSDMLVFILISSLPVFLMLTSHSVTMSDGTMIEI